MHFTLKPPFIRSVEQNWLGVQAEYLRQIGNLSERNKSPIICIGDIFDHWDAPAELINFLILHIPRVYSFYSIPGQHDLPNHNSSLLSKSAYETLQLSNTIQDITYGPIPYTLYIQKNVQSRKPLSEDGNLISITVFAWGVDLKPVPASSFSKRMRVPHVAIAHKYVWSSPKDSFPNAPKEARVQSLKKSLEPYSWAFFGDNHKGFQKGNVFNCGTFMRRKADEIDYKPRVAMLQRDGILVTHELNTKHDKFLIPEESIKEIQKVMSLDLLIDDLKTKGGKPVDFVEEVLFMLKRKDVPAKVKDVLRGVIAELK